MTDFKLKKLPPLSERDWEVLSGLAAHHREHVRGSAVQLGARALDVGGTSGSYHRETLGKLVRHGYARVQSRKGPSRCPNLYFINDAGMAAVRAREA